MKLKIIQRYVLLYLTFVSLNGCVEPYELKSETFDDLLVVEALLTDELKYQDVKLSRTIKLEARVPIPETNAIVRIIDEAERVFEFEETEPGNYISKVEFKAQENISYSLSITTSAGRKYASIPTKLNTGELADFDLFAKSGIDDLGTEGMFIHYEGAGLTAENSKYFRFEYEETYKIIAPYWFGEYLRPNPNGTFSQVFKHHENGKICYGSGASNEIILKNSGDFQDNTIASFPIKFIALSDPKLTHRYSLLVKQYLLSREAYVYYETLKDFSESESLFFENQPGIVNGNLFSNDNPSETVIGFFDVTKTHSKRVFFNLQDFFPDELERLYFIECELTTPSIRASAIQELSLEEMLTSGLVVFFAENFEGTGGPYQVIQTDCGVCFRLGTIDVPDFWEE